MTQAALIEYGAGTSHDDTSDGLRAADAPESVRDFRLTEQEANTIKYVRGAHDGDNQVVELRRGAKHYAVRWLERDGEETKNAGGEELCQIDGETPAQDAADSLEEVTRRQSYLKDAPDSRRRLELPPASELAKECRSYIAKHEEWEASVSDMEVLQSFNGRYVKHGVSAPLEPVTVQTWSERAAKLRPRNMLPARDEHQRVMDRVHRPKKVSEPAHPSPPYEYSRQAAPEEPHPAFSLTRAVLSVTENYHYDDREDQETEDERALIVADMAQQEVGV